MKKATSEEIQQLPNNIEAEKAILGILLNNNQYLEKVVEFLAPEHFFFPAHKNIYGKIIKFCEKGNIANPITLKAHISNVTFLDSEEITGFDYLVKLVAASQIAYDLESLAKHVYDLALRRKLIEISHETIKDSHIENVDISSSDRIEDVEKKLFNLAVFGDKEREMLELKNSLKSTIQKIKEAKERGGNISGVSTQLTEIDRITGGLQNSDLIIIAARPSMGKTALAINIAVNAVNFFAKERERLNSQLQKSVGFVSLEMSADQIATRILSLRTSISGTKIRSGMVDKDEFEKLALESSRLSDFPLFIDDTPALSILSIRSRARRLKRQHNLGILIVDYLQLVRPSGISRESNRVQEIGEISQSLKAMAKELDIPVVALSQLSRAVESRDDKRPVLSDLRESGHIEQDADVVMFIYREEYYLKTKVPTESNKNAEWQQQYNKVKNTAEIIVAKQRNGPVDNCTLRFDSATTNFSNLDFHHGSI